MRGGAGMIRLVDDAQRQEELYRICQGTAFGCKLSAVARAYGFGLDFARFWVGEGAAYGLLDGELSVAGEPGDFEEAREFLGMLGPGSVFCEGRLAEGLGLAVSAEGAVMEKDVPGGDAASFPAPGLGEVCELLNQAGMAVELEPFYLDMSHRIRHGAALALGEYRDGVLVGCAVVSAAVENAAVLSALAVREDCRGKGIGARLVDRVQSALPGRTLYIFRESGKNRAFYEKLGFVESGRWRQQAGRPIIAER